MVYNSSMRRNTKNSFIIYLIVQLVILFGVFIKKAYKRGRILELLSSTAILSGVCYTMYSYAVQLGWYLLPIGGYALYWTYLFSVEKITSKKANPNWANRDWWWTLDGWEFEEEAAEILRLNGYQATVTKKTGDGGIDIILKKNGRKIIAQCKHYSSAVGPEVPRALWGVREDFKADGVMLIASSGITQTSKDFISNKPTFEVLDLEDLISIGLRPIPYKL